ncbi:MAG: ATP-grasp domain-containing protein [Oscillospiraceae bacterium]|nr:ATP-grasp domain-containing protein [Oscillospiraceae bacterium]
MDFFEVEGKKLLQKYGIPSDDGFLMKNADDTSQASYPCVAKAQVLSGHRGRAGGIKVVNDAVELSEAYKKISTLTIGGKKVEGIFVVPAMKIIKEHYLGLTMDTIGKRILLLYSAEGGVDIEEAAKSAPDKLVRMDVTKGVTEEFLRHISAFISNGSHAKAIYEIAQKLYAMFCDLDATTIELNPLAELEDGDFAAADCKLVIDDNALYRQGEYTILQRPENRNPHAIESARIGISYVEVDESGTVGIIAGGAGIGMATVDTVKKYGLTPFNFMDLGAADAEKTYQATKFLLSLPQVKSVIINVFGGFNNCKMMAEGIVRAVNELGSKQPIVVKSRGNDQEEGWRILREANINTVKYGTTDQAVLILKRMETAV